MTTLAVVLAVILGIIFFHPAKIADRAETKVEKLYIQLEDYTKTVSGNFRAFDTRLDETEKDIIELKGKQDTFRVQLQRIADDVKELKEKDMKIACSISISNYNSEIMKEIAEKLISSKKYGKKVREHNIKLISFDEAKTTIQKLKQPME